jgi:hypothetical protein
MRKLNAEQKNLLKKELESKKSIYMYEELSLAVREELERLNDFETIIDEINRFLWEYNTEKEVAIRIRELVEKRRKEKIK